jgi:predicted nucleic acid-binding protein
MPDAVIADTSCFIILSNINELGLLKRVYGTIVTTPDVIWEFGEDLPDWILIRSPKDQQKQKALELKVDRGEASAITLALEIPGSTVILDDLQARILAEQLGVLITGTVGVIIKAKLNGIIPSIRPLLNQIKKTNFRITPALEALALKEANE